MTPDDVGGQDDVGDGDGDASLAELAKLLFQDEDEATIEEESPRAADDSTYGWLESNDGDVVIFDERDPWAWVSSDDAESLQDRE